MEEKCTFLRSGGTQASCFSPDFGGSCFGSVEGCQDCNEVLLKIYFLIFYVTCLNSKAGGISSGGSNNRPSGGSSSRPSRPSRPSSSSGGSNSGCSYNCNGWPYSQCEMSTRWGSATCINPFSSRGSSQIYSNYPNCANVPSGCERCDDVLSACRSRLHNSSPQTSLTTRPIDQSDPLAPQLL